MSGSSSTRRACSISFLSAPLARGRGVLEQDDALGELAGQLRLARLELAAQLVAPGGEDVGPGGEGELPAARACRPRRCRPSARRCGGRRAAWSSCSAHLRAPAGRERTIARSFSWPSRKTSHDDLHEVADRALGWIRAAVDGGLRVLEVDPRRGRLRHLDAEYPPARSSQTSASAAASGDVPGVPLRWAAVRCHEVRRRPAPSHLAARRPPRPRGVRLGRLARRRGPDLVADAAARPAGPLRLAVQGALRLRRLARPAGRAGRAGEQGRGARLPRARGRLDRGLGGASPAAARSPTRCASSASGPRCARTPPSAACG